MIKRLQFSFDALKYSLAVDSDYDSVMATVLEILAARLGGLCLECVLTKTGLRADQALRQIDALPMRVTDGRCGGCSAAGPVFTHAPDGLSSEAIRSSSNGGLSLPPRSSEAYPSVS